MGDHAIAMTDIPPLNQPSSFEEALSDLAKERERLLDVARYAKLDEYNLLIVPTDVILKDALADALVVSRSMCNAYGSALTFVGEDFAHVSASLNGPAVGREPCGDALCTTAVRQENDVMVVPDATKDPRFCDNYKVTIGGFRFYAGALVRLEGVAVGALCVMDKVAREITQEEYDNLSRMARLVAHLLEMKGKPASHLALA